MSTDDIRSLYQSNQALLIGLGALALVGLVLIAANRLRKMTDHTGTLLVANILTIVAAALATSVSASGMWKFFTAILGPSPLRVLFFAFLEVALFTSALLARTRLLRDPQHGTTGVDGIAVWVLAALTATLSALDADSFREVCLRLVAPLVAAWMWERALAAERSARLGQNTTRIHWTITLDRVFTWLHLAEARDRDLSEVDRARRRARLGRARLNLYLLQQRKTTAWRIRRAHHKVVRQAMRAAEHIGLADFPAASNEREAIQMYMATLYGFVDATSPDAVAHLNAWRTDTRTVTPVAAMHRADASASTGERDRPPMPRGTLPATEPPLARLNGHALDFYGSDAAVPEISEDRESQPDPPPMHNPPPPEVDEKTSNADEHDDVTADDEADTSAVAAMRRFWDTETAKGRIPTGAQLSRAAGVPPSTGLGRRKRREWETELPDQLRSAAA